MERIDLNTLPEDFKQLIRSKLKNKDEETFNKALDFYAEGLLGYNKIITARPDSISLAQIEEQKAKEKRKKDLARIAYENRKEYLRGLKRIYSSPAAEIDIIRSGGYCAYIDKCQIVCIHYEEGGARNGGTVYENTRFNTYTHTLQRTLDEIRRKYPKMYQQIKPYIPEEKRG